METSILSSTTQSEAVLANTLNINTGTNYDKESSPEENTPVLVVPQMLKKVIQLAKERKVDAENSPKIITLEDDTENSPEGIITPHMQPAKERKFDKENSPKIITLENDTENSPEGIITPHMQPAMERKFDKENSPKIITPEMQLAKQRKNDTENSPERNVPDIIAPEIHEYMQLAKEINNDTENSPEGNVPDIIAPEIHEEYMQLAKEINNDTENSPVENVPDIITPEMLEEEMKLARETEEEEERIRKEMKEKYDKELKELRYKRLLHLLNRSQFYTGFLLQKLESQQEKQKKKLEEQRKLKPKKCDALARKEISSRKINVFTSESSSLDQTIQCRLPRESNRQDAVNNLACDKVSTSDHENCASAIVPESETGKPDKKRGKTCDKNTDNFDMKKNLDMKECSVQVEKLEPVPKKMRLSTEKDEFKRNPSSTYNIADVINKEMLVKESASTNSANEVEQEPVPEIGEKITSLGYVVSDRQPVLFEGGIMRSYQLEGLEWLVVLYENGVNGILADEMGLGKTIQCIALICHLVQMEVSGPFLVCAPLSTLPNWLSEFQRFAPKLPVVLYHGSMEKREMLRRQIRRKREVDGKRVLPVVITSYEITMKDRWYLDKFKWRYIIVDEGHRIKNFKCQLIRILKQYHSVNKLLLTGTPLQNDLSELWALLNFLLPEIFDDLSVFESWFDVAKLQGSENNEEFIQQEQEQNVLSTLHQILTPFLLRRVKSDVELDIPPKKELIVYAPLTHFQEIYYRATVDKSIFEVMELRDKSNTEIELLPNGERTKRKCVLNRVSYSEILGKEDIGDNDIDKLEKWAQLTQVIDEKRSKSIEKKPNHRAIFNIKMQNRLMQLRKVVNHPYLIEFPINPDTKELIITEDLVKKSGKLLVLDAMLPKLKQEGHKVLLFSQMTMLLDILEEYVIMRDYSYVRLDGSHKMEDRQMNIRNFNSDPGLFLFLISTRAGGLGINLTGADTVIIYDSDWNPQADLQAQDRCHRIGQTRPVVVYRLVTAATVDERVVERAAAKRKLEKLVIHKGKFKLSKDSLDDSTGLSMAELTELLNSRDHCKAVQADGTVFTEKELNMLLDRSDLHWDKSERKSQESTEELTGVYKVIDKEGV